jgi:hypothetical protein
MRLGEMAAFEVFEFSLLRSRIVVCCSNALRHPQETAMVERSRKSRPTAASARSHAAPTSFVGNWRIRRRSTRGNFPASQGIENAENAQRISRRGASPLHSPLRSRGRPEMAPQRLEKIESAPGNGMGSEASNPQYLVQTRA